MSEVKTGQIWKSKFSYPNIGYYIVEIFYVQEDKVYTRYTATEWEDKHWNRQTTTISELLEGYDLQ